jgi:predicted transcriptional regulator
MPRTYSDKFLIAMNQADPYRAGVALAKACVKANLPAKYVASALGVTRMTIYSWFRGKPIRDKNQRVVEVFTEIVEGDIDKGVLPAKSILEAKEYIETILGEPLKT